MFNHVVVAETCTDGNIYLTETIKCFFYIILNTISTFGQIKFNIIVEFIYVYKTRN